MSSRRRPTAVRIATRSSSTSAWTRPAPASRSTGTSVQSIAEFRAVVQPVGLLDRRSGEHWAGRLYMRRLSPYVTRLLAKTSISPNAVTGVMVFAGVAAGGVLAIEGL